MVWRVTRVWILCISFKQVELDYGGLLKLLRNGMANGVVSEASDGCFFFGWGAGLYAISFMNKFTL